MQVGGEGSALILERPSRVKLSIKIVVLGVSSRKNFKMFPCGTSFSRVADKMFTEAP